jgi:hypothetical protein
MLQVGGLMRTAAALLGRPVDEMQAAIDEFSLPRPLLAVASIQAEQGARVV